MAYTFIGSRNRSKPINFMFLLQICVPTRFFITYELIDLPGQRGHFRAVVSLPGTLVLSGDSFWLSRLGGGRTGAWWIEPRDAA